MGSGGGVSGVGGGVGGVEGGGWGWATCLVTRIEESRLLYSGK